MSAEKVIYALLTGAPAVVAQAGARIYPEYLPEGINALAIVFRLVSDVPVDDVAQAQLVRTRRARVQIDVVSATDAHLQRKTAVRAIRSALHGQIGMVAALPGMVVREILTGPDLPHERAGLASSSIDYQVVYQEAARS